MPAVASPTPTLDAVLRRARKGKVPSHAIAQARRELATVHAIASATFHPTQSAILELMRAESPWSPVELSRELREPLPNIAYHVRRLCDDLELIRLVGTAPRRGAVEHFYGLAS